MKCEKRRVETISAGIRYRTDSIPAWQAGAPPFMRHPQICVPGGFEPH